MLGFIRSWLRRIEIRVLAHPARFLLAAFAINGAFVIAFDALDTLPADGPGIIDLHLTNSVAAFEQILREWQSDGIASARRVLRLDLLFPFAYAPLFAGLYFLAIQRIRIEPRRVIVMAPVAAGAADWIETAGTLLMLRSLPTEFAVRAVFVATIVKFSLLALTTAFILAALTRRPAWRVIRVSRYTVLSLFVGTFPLFGLSQGRDLLVGLSNSGAGLEPWFFIGWLAVWAFSTWYWSRVLMDAEGSVSNYIIPEDKEEFEDWAAWLPRWIGALTLFVPGAAILLEVRQADNWGRMLMLGLACVAASGLFLLFVIRRRQKIGAAAGKTATGYSRGGLTVPLKRIVRVSAIVSAAMFVLLTFYAEFSGFTLGAAAILAIAAANTVFFGSVAVFVLKAYAVPLEVLLIAAAITFSFWNDNHAIDISRPAAARAVLADAFKAWESTAPPAENGGLPIVIVTAEGGGIRAAHWTSAVLHTLDDDPALRFADRLFAISSVSGSSFGAAVYAGLKKDTGGASGQRDVAKRILQRKFLAPMVGRLVTGDFAQWFLPAPIEAFDRSSALADGFERAYSDAVGRRTMAVPLAEFRRVDEPKVPWLLFNSTSVRSGRRVVLSSVDWWNGNGDGSGPVDFHDWAAGDVSIASAAHNTARFPLISAAGLVRSKNDAYLGHLVDGGYFENTGADTAIDLIEQLRRLDLAQRLRFIVIEVANSAPLQDETTIDWRRSSFLGEVLSPVRALFYARDARGTLATTRLRSMVSRYVVIRPCRGDAAQPPRSAPLGWQLSDEMVRLLYDAAAACVARERQALDDALR